MHHRPVGKPLPLGLDSGQDVSRETGSPIDRLVKHDHGCKWGRFDSTVNEHAEILTGEVRPGHSDTAKRFSDTFNLHHAAGQARGWIAVGYADSNSGARA